MAKIAHYEVYIDSGSGWRLVERFAADQRQEAYRLAKESENGSNKVKIINNVYSYIISDKADVYNINRDKLYYYDDGKYVNFKVRPNNTFYQYTLKDLENLINEIKAVKQNILNELALKIDKERIFENDEQYITSPSESSAFIVGISSPAKRSSP